MRFSSSLLLSCCAVLSGIALPGCSKPSGGSSAATHSTTSASGASGGAEAAAPGASARGAADAPRPCKIDVAPFVVDRGVRGETGVTLARLPDDRFAVGYATNEGAPRAAVILPEGSASVVDVDASKVPLLAQRPVAKARRYVHRVTPIASKELKMRVAVDVTEVRPEGGRWVRCGPADDEPLFTFEGPSVYDGADAGQASATPSPELRDCRSFAAGGAVWGLGFETDTSGAVESRWVAAAAGAPLDEAHASIEHKAVPAEAGRASPLPRASQVDRYGYTSLAATRLGEAGYLVASRYNGKLRLAKRASDWAPAGPVTDYWFGAAIGTPAMASRDSKVVVLTPVAGTLDLYGAAFAIEAEPPKPQKIPLADALDAPAADASGAENERNAVTVAITSKGKIVAAFLDGKPGKRRPRFAVFDEALKPEGPAFEVLGTGEADVEDIKVAVLPDDRVVVSAVVAQPGAGLTLEGAVLRCQ